MCRKALKRFINCWELQNQMGCNSLWVCLYKRSLFALLTVNLSVVSMKNKWGESELATVVTLWLKKTKTHSKYWWVQKKYVTFTVFDLAPWDENRQNSPNRNLSRGRRSKFGRKYCVNGGLRHPSEGLIYEIYVRTFKPGVIYEYTLFHISILFNFLFRIISLMFCLLACRKSLLKPGFPCLEPHKTIS